MTNFIWFILITITIWLTLFIIGTIVENIIKVATTSKIINKIKITNEDVAEKIKEAIEKENKNE